MREPLSHFLERRAVEAGLLPIGGKRRARVLMYHGIGEPGCERVNVRHISTVVFEHHLSMFREHFHVVAMHDLARGVRHPGKLTIALTFDDGLRNNLTHALPLLEKYGLPATFFITGANPAGLRCLWGDLLDLAERVTERPLTIAGERFTRAAGSRYASEVDGTLLNHRIKKLGVLGPKRELYDQLGDLLNGPLQEQEMFWKLMTDDELRRVAEHPLITLGSHGWWHNDMGRIPLADAVEELRMSKAYLEELSGRAVSSLAWPAGSYSHEAMTAAERAGFLHQFAVEHLHREDLGDPRILNRYGVYDFPVRDRYLRHLIAQGAV